MWRQAEARARADAAAPLVAAAMREATAHEGAKDWPAAAAAASKAADLAETGGADDDVLASARGLAARLRQEEAAARAVSRTRREPRRKRRLRRSLPSPSARRSASSRTVPRRTSAWVSLSETSTASARPSPRCAGRRSSGCPAPTWRSGAGSGSASRSIEDRLGGILSGKARPRDPRERADFAYACSAKGLHAEAVRLYTQAFEEDPAVADDLASFQRYNAACAAVLAAVEDPGLRRRALEWLCADLAARQPDKDKAALAATFEHWKRDPDLAAVRDRINDLPEAERQGWRKLWADVDTALAAK